MPADELDVLLIEDNPGDVRLIEEMLRDAEELLQRVNLDVPAGDVPQVHHEQRVSAGLDRLSETPIDIILLDLGLPDSTGLDTLATVTDATEFVPIVVLTGLRDEQVGVEAIQHGAQDYLVKDEVTSDLLVRSIHHAVERNRQDRERAQRRKQLETLNTLTRELMDVETAAQVSEYVVKAAEEMLDFPVTAIALYDDQEGVLFPAEMTDTAAEVVRTTSLLDIGDGAGWQAYLKNDTRRVTLSLDDVGGSVHLPVTELAIFPLAKHGVLIIGSTAAGGFSAADFDFAETIAGNVKATFDRVNRERQLHEREQTLEEQNQTLARLDRVNDIIRDLAQALVRASTREEIETAVCEQLADVGLYELAWIGEHDSMAEEITPRESVGNEKGYLDSITISTDDSPEAQGPTGQAVKSREPQVVNNILENSSYEPWRRDALARGYHATIALPLIYEDTLHGVLNVYAGQPGVFDELDRGVLTELADTIAFAINAIESKKMLVSNEVTRLKFTVTDSTLAVTELTCELDCTFTLKNVVPRSDEGVRAFFSTKGAAVADILEFRPRLPILNLTLISEYDEDSEPVCLFEADVTDESIAMTILEHGGRIHSLSGEDGTATVTVELATNAAVREFVEMFQTKYPDSGLVAQRTYQYSRRSPTELRGSLTETLTDRQLESLQTAYFSGFFETPRKRTGTNIADSMDISQPTFNYHLRTAQRKLCYQLFEVESLQD